MSPIIFNMVIDRMLQRLPNEIGVSIDNIFYNALMFADDMIFVASTPIGLQMTIDTASDYLAKCGLYVNASKSSTVALRNVPHLKKAVVDGATLFT